MTVEMLIERALAHPFVLTAIGGVAIGMLLERAHVVWQRRHEPERPYPPYVEVSPGIEVDNDTFVAMRLVALHQENISAKPIVISYKRDGRTVYAYRILLPDGTIE